MNLREDGYTHPTPTPTPHVTNEGVTDVRVKYPAISFSVASTPWHFFGCGRDYIVKVCFVLYIYIPDHIDDYTTTIRRPPPTHPRFPAVSRGFDGFDDDDDGDDDLRPRDDAEGVD